MKKILLLIIVTGMTHAPAFSQLYMTKTGVVIIHSETILETIHAENRQVYAIIDTKSKNIAFSLLVKGIEFDRKLMQEHFNENYAESDKFPRATFTGSY
ncbi:MAG: YceI family protein, partial [Flavitalea sp.]